MEIKESRVNAADKYNQSHYSESGIYINTDDLKCKEYIFIDKNSNTVGMFMYDDFKSILGEPRELKEKPKQENTVTESFALKLVALARNEVKINNMDI